ncbi:MAG: hypothetical protein LBC59_04435 [Chitinispirillales bacterium]|nr:hypothetical protein [Chitinispirillales bacterium]
MENKLSEKLSLVFCKSETIQITGNEIFDWVEPLNMKAIRAKVILWMEEHGYFRNDYKNEHTGWGDIAVTKRGIEDSLQHFSGPEKVQSFAALPEMIRNGILVATNPGKSYQTGMKKHIFAARVNIGDKSKLVGFVISEDGSGRRFYNHELTKTENLGGLSSHAGTIGLGTEKANRTRQDSIIATIQKWLHRTT